MFDNEFKTEFDKAGITYEHRLIDDMVAAALKWSGKFIWACKNYDGDVQSDTVAQGFGSLGLMTSVLMTPDGKTVEAEARTWHGDPPLPGASARRGNVGPIQSLPFSPGPAGLHTAPSSTANEDLKNFAQTLEKVCVDTGESGHMTKDLALLIGPDQEWLSTTGFLDKIDENLQTAMGV